VLPSQRTSLGGSPGGVATVFQVRPRQFIGVPLNKPRDGNRHVPGTRRLSIANSPPQEIASPETVSGSRITFNQESQRPGAIPATAQPSDRPKGRSALSSWFPDFHRTARSRTNIRLVKARCVRHHPSTRQRVATALPRHRPDSLMASAASFTGF